MAELRTAGAPRDSQTGGSQQPFGTLAADCEIIVNVHDVGSGMREAQSWPTASEAKKCTWQQNAARMSGVSCGRISDTAAPAGATSCIAVGVTVSETGTPVAAQRETT